jgi:ribosomal protein S12 methylthiotransferase
VLIEGEGDLNGDAVFVGRSRRDAPEVDGVVVVTRPHTSEGDGVGTIIQVRVTAALDYDLVGVPVEAPVTVG